MVNGLGINNIEQRIFGLTDFLQGQLRELGVTLVTHPEKEARSGITVFRCYDDPERDMAIVQGLLKERIYVAVRYTSHVGGIMVSTNFFNKEDDISYLCSVFEETHLIWNGR